jgi:hypothetical protein
MPDTNDGKALASLTREDPSLRVGHDAESGQTILAAEELYQRGMVYLRKGDHPHAVEAFAAAFGAWSVARSKSREIVLGRDSRVSGPMFHRAVVAASASVVAAAGPNSWVRRQMGWFGQLS